MRAARRQQRRGVADAAVQIPDEAPFLHPQLLHRPGARQGTHCRVHLLEGRGREPGLRAPPRHDARGAVHRLPPADHAVAVEQGGAQRVGLLPRRASRFGDDVAVPLAVEPQREPCQPRRQQIEMPLHVSPQGHQTEVRDVAIGQGEHHARVTVGMEPDDRLAAQPPDRQRDLRAVAPLLGRLDDLRVGAVEFADPPQGVAHEGALRLELCLVGQLLQLTAATVVPREVGTGRRDSCGTGRRDLGHLTPREPLVQLHARPQHHTIARRRAGHEHGPPVGEPTYAVAARSDARDGHEMGHSRSPSRNAGKPIDASRDARLSTPIRYTLAAG